MVYDEEQMLGEAAGHWVVLTTMRCRSWVLEKLYVL